MTDDMTPGGSKIYRHESLSDPDPLERLSGGDGELIGAVERPLDSCFGGIDLRTYHELASPMIHPRRSSRTPHPMRFPFSAW